MALVYNINRAYALFQPIIFSTDILGKKIIEFGDGEFQYFEGNEVSHIYKNSGSFEATVRKCSSEIVLENDKEVMTILDFVKDDIIFTQNPVSAFSSSISAIDFELCLSSSCPPPLHIKVRVDGTISDLVNGENLCNPSHYFKGDNLSGDTFILETPKEIRVNDTIVGYHDKICFQYFDDYNGEFKISATLDKTCGVCSDAKQQTSACKEIWWVGGTIDDTIKTSYDGIEYAINRIGHFSEDFITDDPWGYVRSTPMRQVVESTEPAGILKTISGDALMLTKTGEALDYINNNLVLVNSRGPASANFDNFRILDCQATPCNMPVTDGCVNLGTNSVLIGFGSNVDGYYNTTVEETGSVIAPYRFTVGELVIAYNPFSVRWEAYSSVDIGSTLFAYYESSDPCNPFGPYTEVVFRPSWNQFSFASGTCV